MGAALEGSITLDEHDEPLFAFSWEIYLYADKYQAGDQVDLPGWLARVSCKLLNRQAVVAICQSCDLVAGCSAAVGVSLVVSCQGHQRVPNATMRVRYLWEVLTPQLVGEIEL